MTDKCRWDGADRPRILADRHVDGCTDEACRGCQPCEYAHCRVCGVTHSVGACPGCLTEVRENLGEIVRLYDSLPSEVEAKGVETEALSLLGPTADPEARGHLRASVAAGRLAPDAEGEVFRDQEGNEITDPTPLWALGTWAMVYRDAFGHDEPTAAVSVHSEASYLTRNLTEAAQEPWVAFEEFALHLRRSVTHLERVLHDGEQIEKGAPCPQCGKSLKHVWGKRLVDDRWVCENKRCDVTGYTTAQYRGWVEDDALHSADRLTAADMERRFRDDFDEALVTAGEVRVWGSKGYIRKRGRNSHGITLYDVAEVEVRAEVRRAERACA